MLTRRTFLGTAAATATMAAGKLRGATGAGTASGYAAEPALSQLPYASVTLNAGPEESQRAQTQATLAALEDDSLLLPLRKLGGIAAPGVSLGGWYAADGWAPAHCLGQWMSALARDYACNPAQGAAQRARLQMLVGQINAMGPALARFFLENPFPSYTYDKLLLGAMDAETLADISGARAAISALTTAAEPALLPRAMDRNTMCGDASLMPNHTTCLDENYTLPENQFLAWKLTGDQRYYDRGRRFLVDAGFFDELAEGHNALIKQHAYSHLNAVSSGLEAYFATGNEKYRRAAENGFRFVLEQSYPTGGWGPEEEFVDPTSNRLEEDLTRTHRGFETPCGAYAHFKLARRLMAMSLDSRYGDSMERLLYNTLRGALPLETDGRAFYYSDYNLFAAKTYFPDRWPCCAGTIAMVAADYRRNIYLAGPGALFVNLYLSSTVAWNGVSISQSGKYPLQPEVSLSIAAPKPATFTLALRIPEWASGAEIAINGTRQPAPETGRFARIRREWKDGDRVELTLPLAMRLEPLNARTPQYAALVRGPLALFGYVPDPDARSAHELLSAAPVPNLPGYFAVREGHPLRLSTFEQIAPTQSYSLFQHIRA